jgi:signal transduction histidine kinase
VYRYITKPWDKDELKITIDNAIETVMLRRSNKQLIQDLRDYNDQLEEKVKERTQELQEQADRILSQNEEIQSQAEVIQGINDNLESMVKARTLELEKKNKAAEESAFIIAHELRAPVASVLGLINLASRCNLDEETKTIFTHLEQSAEKLNNVVREITKAIERGDR